MALDAPPEARRSLHDDEEGSAAVEFIVLLPVYLLLLFGLFSLSFMMMARQALPVVARYEVWAGAPLEDALRIGVVGNNGVYQSQFVTARANTTQAELQNLEPAETAIVPAVSADQARMAETALNNAYTGQADPFIRRDMTATFQYNGIVLGNRNVQMSIAGSVFVWEPHQRPVHQSGSQQHFAEDNPFQPGGMFDPSQAANEYQPARIPRFGGDGPGDPGLWNVNARIGNAGMGAAVGTPQTEHTFYRTNNVKQ